MFISIFVSRQDLHVSRIRQCTTYSTSVRGQIQHIMVCVFSWIQYDMVGVLSVLAICVDNTTWHVAVGLKSLISSIHVALDIHSCKDDQISGQARHLQGGHQSDM